MFGMDDIKALADRFIKEKSDMYTILDKKVEDPPIIIETQYPFFEQVTNEIETDEVHYIINNKSESQVILIDS